MKNVNTSSGFTMIETLVSLVIISLGILGFALLQVESLKASKTANERAKAIQFASDMMDRARSYYVPHNANIMANFDTGGISGPGSNNSPCFDTASTNNQILPPTCSSAQMIAYEIWQWRTAIIDPKLGFGLAGQAGIAVIGANAPYEVEITIQWQEKDQIKNYLLKSQIN